MGLFARIFGSRQVREIVDAELGTLRQVRGEPRWTGALSLPGLPDGDSAHLELSGGDDGPDERARADALKLRDTWDELLHGGAVDLLLLMEENASDGDPDRVVYDRKTILEEYELRSVRLQSLGAGAYLEVGFDARSNDDHFFHVDFKDWEKAGYGLDG